MDRERRPRVTAVWTAIITLAALLLAVPAARAQDQSGAPDRFERVDASRSTTFRPAILDPDRMVHVMLRLRDDPVAVARNRSRSTAAQRETFVRGPR